MAPRTLSSLEDTDHENANKDVYKCVCVGK